MRLTSTVFTEEQTPPQASPMHVFLLNRWAASLRNHTSQLRHFCHPHLERLLVGQQRVRHGRGTGRHTSVNFLMLPPRRVFRSPNHDEPFLHPMWCPSSQQQPQPGHWGHVPGRSPLAFWAFPMRACWDGMVSPPFSLLHSQGASTESNPEAQGRLNAT